MRDVLPDDRPPVPLRAQIEEVERELAMRANVYPKWVAGRKMTQAAAEEHIRRMLAVLKTLQDLKAHQDESESWSGIDWSDLGKRKGKA